MGLTLNFLLSSAIVIVGLLSLAEAQYNTRWPTYSLDNMPNTNFHCRDKILGGYYADAETQCQMFHVCVKVAGVGIQDFKFLCPNGTAFDQEAQICASWGDIDCDQATLYYGSDNFDLYRIGSGLESKRIQTVDDQEPVFHLQNAESNDIVRSRHNVNDLKKQQPNSTHDFYNRKETKPVHQSKRTYEKYTTEANRDQTQQWHINSFNNNERTKTSTNYEATTNRNNDIIKSTANVNYQEPPRYRETTKTPLIINYAETADGQDKDEIIERSHSSNFYAHQNERQRNYNNNLNLNGIPVEAPTKSYTIAANTVPSTVTTSSTTTTTTTTTTVRPYYETSIKTTSRPKSRGRSRGNVVYRSQKEDYDYFDYTKSPKKAADFDADQFGRQSTSRFSSTTPAARANNFEVRQHTQPAVFNNPEQARNAIYLQRNGNQQRQPNHIQSPSPSPFSRSSPITEAPSTTVASTDKYDVQRTTHLHRGRFKTNLNNQFSIQFNANANSIAPRTSTTPVANTFNYIPTSTSQPQYQERSTFNSIPSSSLTDTTERNTPTAKKFSTLVPKHLYDPTTFRPHSFIKGFDVSKAFKDFKKADKLDKSFNYSPSLSPSSPFIQQSTPAAFSNPPQTFSPTTTTTTTTTRTPNRGQNYFNNNAGYYQRPTNVINFTSRPTTTEFYRRDRTEKQSSENSYDDELLKTAHSQNFAASKNELNNVFEKTRLEKFNNGVNPRPFSKPFAPVTAEFPTFSPTVPTTTTTSTTYRPTVPVTTQRITSTTAKINYQQRIKAPTKSVSKRPPHAQEDSNYDYAYYDSLNENPHDYSEYDIEDFKKSPKKLR